jgi:serine protease Do
MVPDLPSPARLTDSHQLPAARDAHPATHTRRMLSADTKRLARHGRRLRFNPRMPLASFCAALIAVSAAIPGVDVDSAADDRAIFQKLERATAELAEKGGVAVKREARLEQCKRTRTDAVRLPQAGRESTPLDGAEAYRRGAQAAVLIGSAYKCDKCAKWHNTLASGFAITSDGVIATNHHVAAGATGEAMGVMTSDGRFFPVVEVLATDKAHDVALLRIDAKALAFLPLRDDAPAGTAIRCYSHPANTFGCISEGVIARYFHMNEPERNGAVFMQITADYARGSSGGPILDAYGNAVGMVASTSPVFTAPPTPAPGAKETKTPAPSQQMVRHNCATARAILDLTRGK